MNYKRINDVFPEWVTSGIFTTLNGLDVPWKNVASDVSLNIAYHGSHSGDKIISPLINKMLENGELTTSNLLKIVNMLYTVNNTNWSKLWSTMSFDYNPIENYSMTESEHVSGTDSMNGNDNSTGTQTNTATNNNGVYGFNSSNAVNSDTQSGTASSTTENGRTTESESTHANERTLTRSGNIGVMSSQQMINQERELWDWFFYNVVFKDLDKFLTLSIY